MACRTPPSVTNAPRCGSSSRDKAVEVLGFYSTGHRGIFTPKDSDLHMHFRTLDGRASGHVERIAVDPGAVIAVPGISTFLEAN